MSILSALKAKGAKGKNIEEAVKTLPMSGGSGGDGDIFYVNVTATQPGSLNPSVKCYAFYTDVVLDKTYSEIVAAIDEGKSVVLKLTVSSSPNSPIYLYMYQDLRSESSGYSFVSFSNATYEPYPADNKKAFSTMHMFKIYENGEIIAEMLLRDY